MAPKKGKNVGNCFLCRTLKREQERKRKRGRGRRFWPQLINRTLFRLACTHYLFTGAFSQSEGNMFQHLGEGGKGEWWRRERRWDELLPGVGRCHGVPSGDSIAARRAHQRLNAKGEGVCAVEKLKVVLKHWAQTSLPHPLLLTATYRPPQHLTGMYGMWPVCGMHDWQGGSV